MSAIRYRLRHRWADWYHGRRDGWAGIPGKPPGRARARPVTTPHRDTLTRRAKDAIEHERLVYEAARTSALERVAGARARRDELRTALAWATRELAAVSVPLEPAERVRRRYGEDRRPEKLVVARRLREHEKRRREALARRERAGAQLAAAEDDLAAAATEVDQRLRAAAHRVSRIIEHTQRRLAAYKRVLVRVHPHGAWVDAALGDLHTELPDWVREWLGPEEETKHPLHTPWPHEPSPAEPPSGTESGQGRARKIPLRDELIFGSEVTDPPHVLLTAPGIAPRHCVLTRVGERFRLRDFGHGNGPYIGGRLVRTAWLGEGGHFEIADRRYTVLKGGQELWEAPLGDPDLIVDGVYARRGRQQLINMSFVLRERRVLAILGPSGAGKSTLFSALLGDLPINPGRIYFEGLDHRKDAAQIRAALGYVPQDIDLYPTLKVHDLLDYAYRLRSPETRAQRAARIRDVCAKLELLDQLGQPVGKLSGGQKRRVSIALELLTTPRLLMLDEPTSGLDADLDRQVMTFLQGYAEHGATVMVVTHATEHLVHADEVLVVAGKGRPIHFGPPHTVLGELGCDSWADVMKRLKQEPEAVELTGRYAAGPQAAEAGRQAELAADQRRPVPERPDRTRRAELIFIRQLRALVRRQLMLQWTRGSLAGRLGPLLPFLPLVIAVVLTLLIAWMSGAAGLGPGSAPHKPHGHTELGLLTTLCMLSGQALTYSDTVADYAIIRREHRYGTLVSAVLLARWLVFGALAVAQAGLIAGIYLAIRPGPADGLLLPAHFEFFVDLACLSVASMTLGLLVSALSRKLEHAVAFFTATSLAQIALNGITSDISRGGWSIGVLSWILPDRWGLGAAAATVNLRDISRGPAPEANTYDALWTHSLRQWATDLLILGVLTGVCFWLAVVILRRRLTRAS